MDDTNIIDKAKDELSIGMGLPKCKKCGCMRETLSALSNLFINSEEKTIKHFSSDLETWRTLLEPISYSCLGCEHCYPAVATNIIQETFSAVSEQISFPCLFETQKNIWPPVIGEYFNLCDGSSQCSVAVSTLASPELAEKLAERKPVGLCITGKTETENIGIDKVIKNIITNPSVKTLLLTGHDSEGHLSGKTLYAVWKYGTDDRMRVINSPGKRPILKNVTKEEVELFRKQVTIIDMIECQDVPVIIQEIEQCAGKARPLFVLEEQDFPLLVETAGVNSKDNIPIIQAKEPVNVPLDKKGYFVIYTKPEKTRIIVEYYTYDNTLKNIIEGSSARDIYWTIISNEWVTELSHAAYLGKELMKAELSIKLYFKYVQDGG